MRTAAAAGVDVESEGRRRGLVYFPLSSSPFHPRITMTWCSQGGVTIKKGYAGSRQGEEEVAEWWWIQRWKPKSFLAGRFSLSAVVDF